MKSYCGKCSFFKYEDADGLGWCELWEESDVNCKDEDADGLGWCELWEESDVNCKDEACVEYQEDEVDYE